MTTIMAPAGLVPLEAPLPPPREYDLLAAASLVVPESNRWLAGAWIGGDAPGPAYTHDPCSSGTDRAKMGPGDIITEQAYRFTVYMPGFCTAQSIGPDPEFWTDRLKQVFQIYEGAAVERMLAFGDGHQDAMGNHYLGDPNMETLGGGVVTPLRGLELLETAIARHGGGIIHAAPATATAWAAETLVTSVRGQMVTTLGTRVAVGVGYIGVKPDNGSAPAADQEWAFASGPIQIYRQPDIDTIGAGYAQSLDRSTNDVLFIAERSYLINWLARNEPGDTDHTQAGVLIDLVP